MVIPQPSVAQSGLTRSTRFSAGGSFVTDMKITRASAQPRISFPDEDRGCAARGTLIGLLVVVPFWVVVALLA